MTQCTVCQVPSDRYLCGSERTGSGCLGRLLANLAVLAELGPELEVTLSGQDKVSRASVGFTRNGGDEQPLPLNLGASAAGEQTRGVLFTWVRALWEDNATPDANGDIPPLDVKPTIADAALWLHRHPSWLALHPAADEFWPQIRDEARRISRAVDIPRDSRVFLGKCGAETPDESGGDPVACTEELWARSDTSDVSCPTCGASWEAEARRVWLLAYAEGTEGTAEFLSGLLSQLGIPTTAKDIQALAKAGKIKPTSKVDHGKRKYRVGDVLDQIASKSTEEAA